MSSLGRLQHCLERIYEVRSGYDVDHFVITDAALARSLDTGAD